MPIALMLATLTDRRDFGEDWLLERKLDGERCVARKDGGTVRLESRNGKDLTGTYPEVRGAVGAQRSPALLIDGELVAFDDEQTSFSRLQQRLGVAAARRIVEGEGAAIERHRHDLLFARPKINLLEPLQFLLGPR